jgi:hypothetical protein
LLKNISFCAILERCFFIQLSGVNILWHKKATTTTGQVSWDFCWQQQVRPSAWEISGVSLT